MAIKLTISGKQADLSKTQTLELNQLSDFFNLEVVEATFSLPFNLPKTPTNRKLFKHVDIPASNQPITEEFPAVVEIDGLVAKEGIFVLTGIEDEFEGFLKTDAGVFSPIKDSLIGSFVDDVVELSGQVPRMLPMTKEKWGEAQFDKYSQVDFLFDDTDEVLNSYYGQLFDGRFDNKESNISFPLMWNKRMSELFTEKEGQQPLDYATYKGIASLINHTRVFQSESFVMTDQNAVVFNSLSYPATEFRPCVKVKHILSRIVESQGWRFQWNISDYHLNQMILIAAKGTMVFPMQVGELLPEMKVKDFINSLRKLGLVLKFDSRTQTVIAEKASTILASTKQKDLTEYMSPKVGIENLENVEDSGFGFDYDNEEERTGELIGSFSEWLYRPISNQNYGNMALDKSTNSYIKALGPFNKQVGTPTGFQESIWSSGFRTDSFVQNPDLHQKSVTDFIPVVNNRRVFETFENYLLTIGLYTQDEFYLMFVNRRIRELKDSDEVINNSIRIRFLDSPEYGDAFYNTIIREEGETFFPDESLLVLFVREPNVVTNGKTVNDKPALLIYYLENQDLPKSILNPNYYNLPHIQEAEEGKPLIALWHGIQEGYRFASSGNYSPNGSLKLCETAIRWEEEDGLEAQLFTEFLQTSQNRKSFTFKGKLKLSDCLNFDPFQKILIDWVEYLVVSFKPTYRNDRPNERVSVELELRRV